jgi:hypothetical protein
MLTDAHRLRAENLHLYGLLAHWTEIEDSAWVAQLLDWEESTLVTTNKSFAEWSEVFPNAACVVALIDRLVHNAEIIAIKGKSYRQKEAQERAEQRSKKRKATTSRNIE